MISHSARGHWGEKKIKDCKKIHLDKRNVASCTLASGDDRIASTQLAGTSA